MRPVTKNRLIDILIPLYSASAYSIMSCVSNCTRFLVSVYLVEQGRDDKNIVSNMRTAENDNVEVDSFHCHRFMGSTVWPLQDPKLCRNLPCIAVLEKWPLKIGDDGLLGYRNTSILRIIVKFFIFLRSLRETAWYLYIANYWPLVDLHSRSTKVH